MLCEKCKKKKAVIYYNENLGGEVRSFNLCTECADAMRLSGELEELSSVISGVSSPFTEMPKKLSPKSYPILIPRSDTGATPKCPGCGISLREISDLGYTGCARCYAFFAEDLAAASDILRGCASASAGGAFIGKAPRSHREKLEKLKLISEYKSQLKAAIDGENYELAASLRDRIREIESAVCVK